MPVTTYWTESQINVLASLWESVNDDLPEVDVENVQWHLAEIQREFPEGTDTANYARMLCKCVFCYSFVFFDEKLLFDLIEDFGEKMRGAPRAGLARC